MVLRRGGFPEQNGAARFAATLLLVLALLWQAFTVQTHIDPQAQRFAPGISASDAPVAKQAGAGDSSAPCFLCEELALSGHYIAASPVLFATPAIAIAWFAPVLLGGVTRRTRSHRWRSRAPPTLHNLTIA